MYQKFGRKIFNQIFRVSFPVTSSAGMTSTQTAGAPATSIKCMKAAAGSSSSTSSSSSIKQAAAAAGAQPSISTIFFDLDNTLIPTRKADTKACNKVSDCDMMLCYEFDHFLCIRPATNYTRLCNTFFFLNIY